jgi:hypothetical protein
MGNKQPKSDQTPKPAAAPKPKTVASKAEALAILTIVAAEEAKRG